MLHWNWRSFQELSKSELYELLALRQSVFTLEQQCLYPDLDFRDQSADHLLGMQNNKLAAYLRLLPKDLAYPNALSIGRVVTASFARGKGYGQQLMTEVLRHTDEQYPNIPIIISAQFYLERFYQSFGFQSIGEPYPEDNIPHIKMKRSHQ